MTTPTAPATSICRACGISQQVYPSRRTFVRHADHAGRHCPGSGKTRGEIDDMLRTFDCWENTKEVTRRVQVVDNGDSVSLVNTLSVESASVEVAVRLEAQDVLRLIDELGVIARERGWHRTNWSENA